MNRDGGGDWARRSAAGPATTVANQVSLARRKTRLLEQLLQVSVRLREHALSVTGSYNGQQVLLYRIGLKRCLTLFGRPHASKPISMMRPLLTCPEWDINLPNKCIGLANHVRCFSAHNLLVVVAISASLVWPSETAVVFRSCAGMAMRPNTAAISQPARSALVRQRGPNRKSLRNLGLRSGLFQQYWLQHCAFLAWMRALASHRNRTQGRRS